MKTILTLVFLVFTWMEATAMVIDEIEPLANNARWEYGVFHLINDGSNGYGHIPVPTYHVSCASDTFDGSSDYVGIVLYQKDGRNSFVINGRNIRPGYIYFVRSSKLTVLHNSGKSWHKSAYVHLFGVNPPSGGLVSSGFSHHEGVFKQTSGTFNSRRTAYTGVFNRYMHADEFEMVKNAVIRWSCNGQQNFTPKANCRITRTTLNSCPIHEEDC